VTAALLCEPTLRKGATSDRANQNNTVTTVSRYQKKHGLRQNYEMRDWRTRKLSHEWLRNGCPPCQPCPEVHCTENDSAYRRLPRWHRDLEIGNNAGSRPHIRVVALVPVGAKHVSAILFVMYGCTDKVFRPARRGCVAHDPPKVMLCFPSKKSAGYISQVCNGSDSDIPV
jgi:hypothetical protein